MPGVITRYHRHFLPKSNGFFSKEMGALRSRRAGEIRTLRAQVGRKKARGILVDSMKAHVKGINQAKALAAAKAAGEATHAKTSAQRRKELTSQGYLRSAKTRKRLGGNVYHTVEKGVHGRARSRVKIFGKGDRA